MVWIAFDVDRRGHGLGKGLGDLYLGHARRIRVGLHQLQKARPDVFGTSGMDRESRVPVPGGRGAYQHTIRVYQLKPERVRINTTSRNGYWQVRENGLFQLGHSKDHRPDLQQSKGVLATLGPLGMPLATQVVAGNKADDPLYLPAIDQVRQGLGRGGLLYSGD